ncbi:MAG TPA: hypothetical protein VKD71_08135 [Gemmataceae bacterium]|nr:hypothetical protein [Gemmataceae bacterium]
MRSTRSSIPPTASNSRRPTGIEVLEGIATREAKAVLADWGKGAPEATLTCEAAASLERLKKH